MQWLRILKAKAQKGNEMNIILKSGTELNEAEIFEAALLLTRARSPTPVITKHDIQIACVQLAFDLIEHNDEEGVI